MLLITHSPLFTSNTKHVLDYFYTESITPAASSQMTVPLADLLSSLVLLVPVEQIPARVLVPPQIPVRVLVLVDQIPALVLGRRVGHNAARK